MTILVFGKTGQVARELAKFHDTICLDRSQADLSNPTACADAIHAHTPRAVINAAAYTAVDKAEAEEELATRINGVAPGAMAGACKELGIPFVTISTDYVFDGSGTDPWNPENPTAPIGAYGRSKLAGEQAALGADGAVAILRTSWVVSAYGNNFVKTMLRLGREREELNVVSDQVGAPTPANAIAAACMEMANGLIDSPDKRGIYHLAGQPDTNWSDFATAIFDAAGISCRVKPIPTSAYPTPARRPLNSRLNCASLEAVFGIKRPDWKTALQSILADLGELSDQ